ncbi:MAG: hypothetical protein K2X93_23455 [Candidatus Obscuribacterales bacterium]|nr:hypothetical protein [Candidatus Obscuribacterales bacterium]
MANSLDQLKEGGDGTNDAKGTANDLNPFPTSMNGINDWMSSINSMTQSRNNSAADNSLPACST